MSSMVDYTDRATCPLFGDGAGAVLVEASEDDENGYMDQKTVKERKKKEKPQKKWYVVINKEDLPEDLNNDAFMDFEFDEDFDAGFNGDEDDEIVDEEPVTIEYEN